MAAAELATPTQKVSAPFAPWTTGGLGAGATCFFSCTLQAGQVGVGLRRLFFFTSPSPSPCSAASTGAQAPAQARNTGSSR